MSRRPRANDAEYAPTRLEEEGKKDGTVLWYDPKKGYGFITPDDGGENLFVHSTELRARAHNKLDGQKVEYQTGKLKSGKMVAMNVKGTGLLLKGTMLWFDSKKRYGFITPSDGGDNVFAHGSEILCSNFAELNNELVEYRMGKLKDGKDVAVSVTGPLGRMLGMRPGPPGPWGPPPPWGRPPPPWGPGPPPRMPPPPDAYRRGPPPDAYLRGPPRGMGRGGPPPDFYRRDMRERNAAYRNDQRSSFDEGPRMKRARW